MSSLSSWGVSGPRFDTIQDWTSLANVKPQRRIRRSASAGGIALIPPNTPAHQQGGGGMSHSTSSATLTTPPAVGRNTPGSTGGSGGQKRPQSGMAGSGRIPSYAFASNPYQVSRPGLTNNIANTLSSGGMSSPTLASVGSPTHPLVGSPSLTSLGSPAHQFAIHTLPRTRGHSVGGNLTSPIIPIPSGSAIPVTPAGRKTLLQQQSRNLSNEFAQASISTTYNPYLLTDSNPTATSSATLSASSPTHLDRTNSLFRRTKNLEQRLAEYLKPPRTTSTTSPTKQRQNNDANGNGNGNGGSRNINIHVLPHPKNPLESMKSPGNGGIKSTNVAAANESTNTSEESKEEVGVVGVDDETTTTTKTTTSKDEESKQHTGSTTSPSKSKHASSSNDVSPVRGKKGKKKNVDDDSFDSSHDLDDPAASGSVAPASMNLRAVLRAQKAQEAAAAAEAEKEKELKRPWTGLSWNDIIQAKMYLIHQAKTKQSATATAGAGGADSKTTGHNGLSNTPVGSLAMQVAQQLLNTSKGIAKKPLNIYSLTEFQRNEYKLAVEQGKWLNMYAAEDMRKAQPELIPNDQKKVSTKTRMMNLAKGDVPSQSAIDKSGSQLLYNTYVSCNSQYGYVRYVGRVPWAPATWVGMELVEPHPHASHGAWVDFYHEHSAISMQTIEEASAASSAAAQAAAAASGNNAGLPGVKRKGSTLDTGSHQRKPSTIGDQLALANGLNGSSTGAPVAQMVVNTAIPRPLILAAMIPPQKESKSGSSKSGSDKSEKLIGSNDQYQLLSASIFPFIDVGAFLREGLSGTFEMGDLQPGLIYFAPLESVKRVAQKAKIDSKTLLAHKEHQTNPFADVDELACSTPKKHEGNVEMLARYLTVSDREVLDGERNKARSIFRWICHNIRYDPNAPTKSTDVISLIRHRKSNAEGFSILFHALATAGGLQCLRIRGVEKSLNAKTDQVIRNKHAWNAIKVDGEWSFIDCVFSCGQYVPSESAVKSSLGGSSNAAVVTLSGTFQHMFSDAYFCTPPSLFILEHYPTELITIPPSLISDNFSKLLPSEYNNLQLLRSTVSASEFEKGLIPGRAFVEYHMRTGAHTYHVECKQPSYQIEITAPGFILFDVELKIKSCNVDTSNCSHIQYDGEQVTIFLIFPVPGEYVCKITCKPSWRELEIYDSCLTYRLTSHTGLVPLSSNKDVIIGFLQHRKMNARDSRGLFNRHFTLLHPLSGHLIPKAPFIVQVKGPDIADSVIVACNGDWQRLSSTTLANKSGIKLFEGTALIQPRWELQIFYEMDKKFHLLFNYKANLTSFSNVYQEKAAAAASSSSNTLSSTPDVWHGKCVLGIEGRVFDANLSLDVPSCRFGRMACIFIIHCSVAWDIALQVQEGWRNGTPLPENQVLVEEIKSCRTQLMTQYKVTANLPQTMVDPALRPEKVFTPQERLKQAANSSIKSPNNVANTFVNAIAESKRTASMDLSSNSIPPSSSSSNNSHHDDDDGPKLTTQFTLVVNARNIKQGGPMRYCMSYFFDVAKSGQQGGSSSSNNNNPNNMQIEVI